MDSVPQVAAVCPTSSQTPQGAGPLPAAPEAKSPPSPALQGSHPVSHGKEVARPQGPQVKAWPQVTGTHLGPGPHNTGVLPAPTLLPAPVDSREPLHPTLKQRWRPSISPEGSCHFHLFSTVCNLEVHRNRCLLNYFNNDSRGWECCFIIRTLSTYVTKYLAPDILQKQFPMPFKNFFLISLRLSSSEPTIDSGNREDRT